MSIAKGARVERSSRLKVGLSAGLVLAGVVGIFVFSPLGPRPPAYSLLFGLGAAWFELTSARLPGAGRVSCAFFFLLAMALLPSLGPAFPMLLLLALVGLRSALGGYPEMGVRWLEALLDLLPASASLLALALVLRYPPIEEPFWVGSLVSSLVYCLVYLESQALLASELPPPQRSRFQTVQLQLVGLRLAGCCAGVLASRVGQFEPGWLAMLVPLMSLLPKSAHQIVRQEERDQQRNVIRQLDASKTQLEQASRTQQQLVEDLHRRQDEHRILEAASRTLLQVRDCQQTADEIVNLCHSLVTASSVVVFLVHEDQLYPRSFRTQWPERLQSGHLGGLKEPVLEAAWKTQMVQREPKGWTEERIFAEESQVLVYPLGRAGVLYVGRSGSPFSEEEARHLSQAAGQGALALQIATYLEALQVALQQQASVSRELQEWAGILDGLLSRSLQFLEQMDKSAFLEKLMQTVRELVPSESLEVAFEGKVGELYDYVASQRVALLLDDVSRSRFLPHQPGQKSLLCVPIFHPNLRQVGMMVLGARPQGFFTRWQRDSLSLLGALAAVAWKNIELYEETVAAQGQLVQSSKMAAVGQLAAGIAHELNTPLGSIMLNVESSLRILRANPDQAEKRLGKAKEMIQRTQSIVEKLLYYSRQSDKGRIPSELNTLVTDTFQLVGHSLSMEQVQVRFEEGAVSSVLVNQNEIQQVLFNLLLNARDAIVAGPSASREILVRTYDHGEWSCVEVRDQGPGMVPETLARVFEPFFTTKAVGKGTGLGLSISQQIVEAHGGTLEVVSQVGKGTRFVIRLPH